PVLSMATWVTPRLSSQVASSCKPVVVVAKVRTCLLILPDGAVSSTQAPTVSLWTSSPAQRSYNTCRLIVEGAPFCYTSRRRRKVAARGTEGTTSFLFVLTRTPV